MDSIRRNCHRPTVAVVLSGGGAKGAAEVGALKYLEEQGIPIDFICGTSIGGLVGGLYAVGYKAEDIHELFCTRDWGVTLTDRIEPKYYSYKVKQYNSTYLISIPFKYEDDVFQHRIDEQVAHERAAAIEAGKDGKLNTQKGVNSFASSLPSGYVYGFNVNNLLAALTVGYQDSISFAKLPIPYACVASDMVSCKSKNWGSGTLKTAMRSTMSIPGLFDPVRKDGMVLVDGGTRNNFPADIAKAVGADYIIGIELSDIHPSYSELNNLGNLLSQFITMLGKDSFDKNIDEADLIVKPELDGFNMLSFNAEAVDTMVLRGYRAAELNADLIAEIKSLVPDAQTTLKHRKATDLRTEKVKVKSVEFIGVSDAESLILQRMIGQLAGTLVGEAEINKAMSIVQATGVFEMVNYSMLGTDEPYDLVFNCHKGPIHRMGIGVRMDTEEWVDLALHIGLNAHKLYGSRLDFNGKVGLNQKANLKYTYGKPGLPAFCADAAIEHYFGSIQYAIKGTPDSNLRNDASYWTHRERVYVNQMMWTRMNLELGIQNRYYSLSDKQIFGNTMKENYGEEIMKGDYIGPFVKFELYSFDDKFYPSKGVNLKLSYNGDFWKTGVSGFVPIHSFWADFKGVIPLGQHFAIIPDLHLRAIINNNESGPEGAVGPAFSLSHTNFVGGTIADRYIDGQVPFFGINKVTIASDYLAAATLDLRAKPGKNFYVSLLAGARKDAFSFSELFKDFSNLNFDYAFGAEAGLHTLVGPMKLNVHWDNAIGWGAYFSMGYDF